MYYAYKCLDLLETVSLSCICNFNVNMNTENHFVNTDIVKKQRLFKCLFVIAVISGNWRMGFKNNDAKMLVTISIQT